MKITTKEEEQQHYKYESPSRDHPMQVTKLMIITVQRSKEVSEAALLVSQRARWVYTPLQHVIQLFEA